MMARVRGEMAVIAAAQGNKQDGMTDKDMENVQEHFKEAL